MFSLVKYLTLVTLFTAVSSARSIDTAALDRRLFANASNPKLVFDGRMPAGTNPKVFDSPDTSPYINDTAFGQNLTWSKIITIPKVSPPLFDPEGKEAALEIHITDESVFAPKGNPTSESHIRRAELSPNMSVPESTPIGYSDVSGHRTLHFSLQNNPGRSLNYSHAYNLAWMEVQNFTRQQWKLRTGLIEGTGVTEGKTLMFMGSDETKVLFKTPFLDGWHNFGINMDFNKNTMQLYYSNGTSPLAQATQVISNDMSGGGQYHFGVFKKSTNYNASDGFFGQITGYQATGIDESMIFSSIFMEDSATGTVSLAPNENTKFVGGPAPKE